MKDKAILVVEDGEYQRGLYSFMLKHLGYENIVMAENGCKGLALLEEHSIDLIISDCDMPEMDGLTFLKNVRAKPSCKNIPFLMVTGLQDDDTENEAVKEGVTDFLLKPVSHPVLEEKLNNIFN